MHLRIVGIWGAYDKPIEFVDTEDFFESSDNDELVGFASGFWWAMKAMTPEGSTGTASVSVYGKDGRLILDMSQGTWGGPDISLPERT